MAARKCTRLLLDAVDEGVVNKDTLIVDLMNYLSEREVKDFILTYGLSEAVGLEDDET